MKRRILSSCHLVIGMVYFSRVPNSHARSFAMTTLSVVIPAYNEEDGIAAIVERVLAIEPSLRAAGVAALECIVVDDGSRDRTAAIVEQYAPRVRLIRQINKGYGGALKTGFNAASGE